MRTVLVPATLAVVVMIALTGCATQSPGAPGAENGGTVDDRTVDVRGEWSFLGGSDADGPLDTSDFPLTVEFMDGNARVRTGCYSFDQPLNPELEIVTAGLRSRPLASCLALGEDETAAIESLAGATAADRVGDELVLYSGAFELEFALVPAVPLDVVVGSWSLGGILWGDTAMGVPAGPTLTLSADGTISGSTGCADFSGNLEEIVSGTNAIGDLSIGEAVCTEDFTAVDENVRTVLEGGFLIRAADGALTLVASTSETTLVFHPAV